MPVWLVPILKTLGTNLLLTLMESAVNELKKRDNSVSEEDVKLVQSVRRNNIFNVEVKGSAGQG